MGHSKYVDPAFPACVRAMRICCGRSRASLTLRKKRKKRFRALVEASKDVTIIFSPEGYVTYASPSVGNGFRDAAQRHCRHDNAAVGASG